MKRIVKKHLVKKYELVNTITGSVMVRNAELTTVESQAKNLGYATNKSELRYLEM
jgi:hypothetical protein